MDGNSSTNISLMLKRLEAKNETFYKISYESRSIDRLQAMEKLQPLIDNFDESTNAMNFVADVEAIFTQESVKVLTREGKRTIRLAAEVVGSQKVLDWIAAAKDDMEEFTWVVTAETPKPPADISTVLLEELDILVQAAPSNIQNLLRSRFQVVKMIFETFEKASEANVATNQQLREELSSTRRLLEQHQDREMCRQAVADMKAKRRVHI